MNKKPDFISLFLDSLKVDYEIGGIKYLIPYLLFLCLGVGVLLGFYFFPIVDQPKNPSFFPMIAALVTAQSIILAMSTQASGIVLNNISQGNFSIFLKRNKLLNYYMLLIQLIQAIHILSLIFLLITGLAYFLREEFPYMFKTILSISLGIFLYAVRWTWGTTIVVRDLIYQRSVFESCLERELEHDNITP